MYYGNEKITNQGRELDFSILDFWRWAHSNIDESLERGIFAEYIVNTAVADRADGVRLDGPYDIIGCNGLKIEVKSTAIKHGSGKTGNDTKNSFSIAPVKIWNSWTYSFAEEYSRPSDIYVFAVWKNGDNSNSMTDVDSWIFYVVSTNVINTELGVDTKNVSLSKIQQLRRPCKYSDLKMVIYKEFSEHGNLTFSEPPMREDPFLSEEEVNTLQS